MSRPPRPGSVARRRSARPPPRGNRARVRSTDAALVPPRAVRWGARHPVYSCYVIRSYNIRDRALFDHVQAVAFKADDGARVVDQQHHVPDPEIQQNLRTDAIIAQFPRWRWPADTQPPHALGQRGRAMLADEHDDAASG